MCGRYLLTHSAADIAAFFRTIPTPAEYASGRNISPMQSILVVTGGDEPRLTAMRWGIMPYWANAPRSNRPVINARSETVTEKPLFRDLLQANRCVVPASGYYEWPKSRPRRSKPFEIAFADGEPMAMAALWTRTAPNDVGGPACVIITSVPAQEIAEVHDRMPVLLTQTATEIWLNKATSVPEAVQLLQPWHYDRLQVIESGNHLTPQTSKRAIKGRVTQQLDLWEDL